MIYTYKHKPTQKWVKINQHQSCPEIEIYGYSTSLQLVSDKTWATTHHNIELLEEDLLLALDDKNNILDYELVEVN
jgi:hypothetical protein